MKQLLILEKINDFFRTVQRNKYGSLIGTLILVIIVQFFAIGYLAKEYKKQGRDKDSAVTTYQRFLEQQVSELRQINEMLDSVQKRTNIPTIQK